MLTLNTSTGADLSITGKADLLKALGLTTSIGSGNVTVTQGPHDALDDHGQPDPGRIDPEREWPHHHLLERARAGSRRKSRRARASSAPSQTDGNGNSIVYLQSGTIADTLNAIDLATGVQTARTRPASRR